MTFATAGLILASFSAQDAPDVVKILGRDVPIEFPTGGPVNATTPFVDGAGWKWRVGSGGTLERRFRVDGGWGDLKEQYRLSKGKTGAKPYWVKVVVHQHEATVEKGANNVIRQHWASIDDEELMVVLKSLAVFKASVEGATGGAYEVKLDVVLDNDIEYSYIESRQELRPLKFAPRVGVDRFGSPDLTLAPESERLAAEMGAVINDEKFDTDDGLYRGPYAVAYDIHPGYLAQDVIGFVDNTPVTSLGYYTFSSVPARQSLPTALFEAWKQMVAASAVTDRPVSDYLVRTDFRYPRLVGGPVWEGLIERSRRTTTVDRNLTQVKASLALPDLAKSVLPFVSGETGPRGVVSPSPGQPDRSLLSIEFADFVLDKLKDRGSVLITGIGSSESGGFIEVAVKPSELGPMAAVEGSGQAEPSAKNDPPGTVVGDFGAALKDGPNGSKAWEVSFTGTVCRGHVVLASGSPFIKAGQAGFLSFDARLSEDEEVVLELVDKLGTRVGTIGLGGESFDAANSPGADMSIPADNQWHHVSVSIPEVTGGKEVESLRLRGGFDRLSRGPSPVGVTEPVVSETGTATLPSSAPDPVLETAKIAGTPTPEQAAQLIAALGSANHTLRMTALGALSRVKCAEAVPTLIDLGHSGFVPVAAMALSALGFQGTSECAAAIRETVERGPFDHNRRFAAVELAKRPDQGMGASLNYMSARSWHARLESVRALAAIKSTSAAIIMSTMLQLEPNPTVRLEIARSADSSVELVNTRLIYAAVNDPSQWVRAMAHGRLIDSPFAKIQADALKGVKDDAVGVRLYLLGLMQKGAKAVYRPALRSAVTDLAPAVRAAALRAFATQPDPVDPNEVKNTWNDPDAEVKKALEELAKAKGFKVPPQ